MLLHIAIDIDHRNQKKRNAISDQSKLFEDNMFSTICQLDEHDMENKTTMKNTEATFLLNSLKMNDHDSAVQLKCQSWTPFQLLVKEEKVKVSNFCGIVE